MYLYVHDVQNSSLPSAVGLCSFKPSPSRSIQEGIEMGKTNPVFFGDLWPILPLWIALSYLNNLRLRKLGIVMLIPVFYPMAILFNAISHIVGCASKKQMLWVTAGRIIAFMQNKLPIFNWSISDNVSNSRGVKLIPVSVNHSVARSIFVCNPWPTLMGFAALYLTPKSIFKRFSNECPFSILSKVGCKLTATVPRNGSFHSAPDKILNCNHLINLGYSYIL